VVLVLTICSFLNGACRVENVPLDDAPPTPMRCLRMSQPTIAEWMQRYPYDRVQRAVCVDPSKLERKA
jgi:hypothetical protein